MSIDPRNVRFTAGSIYEAGRIGSELQSTLRRLAVRNAVSEGRDLVTMEDIAREWERMSALLTPAHEKAPAPQGREPGRVIRAGPGE